jgi:YHS domain-containing protein
MVEDPVCGMQLMPEDAVAETEFGGQTYYFCSEECHEEFESDPERYATSITQPAF